MAVWSVMAHEKVTTFFLVGHHLHFRENILFLMDFLTCVKLFILNQWFPGCGMCEGL